ncbi:hypothetical protein NE261_00625 [Enterococcus italicus]|uniref:hypothetical protein n=1 Tax=Enterococcus italicus TaxID=246144 RepID=UPI00207421B4|nr:hypothetical protein [Enterococcus italicus]MCM6930323.1 hypothetical protein [Enterococcus italicus]
MSKFVYVLSKHGTVKNYVSDINLYVENEEEEEVSVSLDFSLEKENAIDLEGNAEHVYNSLTSQLGSDMVGMEEE